MPKLLSQSKSVRQCLHDFCVRCRLGEIHSANVPSVASQRNQDSSSLQIIFCEAFALENGINLRSCRDTYLTRTQLIGQLSKFVYNIGVINSPAVKNWLNYLLANPDDLTLYKTIYLPAYHAIHVVPVSFNDADDVRVLTEETVKKYSLALV